MTGSVRAGDGRLKNQPTAWRPKDPQAGDIFPTLSTKLGDVSDSLGKKMKELFNDQFEAFFDRKMLRVYGTLVTIVSFGLAIYNFVLKSAPPARQAWIFLSIAGLALLFTLLMTRKQ